MIARKQAYRAHRQSHEKKGFLMFYAGMEE